MKRTKLFTLLLTLTMVLAMSQMVFADDYTAKGGTYTYNGTDIERTEGQAISEAVSQLEPGDTVKITLTYKNDTSDTTEWYMENTVLKTLEEEAGMDGGYTYVLSNIGPDGKEIKRGGEFLGFSSSRLAEYYGLKEGLEQAIELGFKRVHFKSDCLMMVNQMNGVYKVKNPDLFQVHNDVLKLLDKLEAYSFTHVPRELNTEADAEVNRVIDQNVRRGEY